MANFILGKIGVYVNGGFRIQVHVYSNGFDITDATILIAGSSNLQEKFDASAVAYGASVSFGRVFCFIGSTQGDFLARSRLDSDAKSVLMYNLVRAVVAELADALA
jgi:hypothetical protein